MCLTWRMSSLRKSIERKSAPLLISLSRLPKFITPVIVGILLFIGLSQRNALGVVCIAVVATFIIWLSYLAWPVLDPRARVVRSLLIGMLLVGTILNFTS